MPSAVSVEGGAACSLALRPLLTVQIPFSVRGSEVSSSYLIDFLPFSRFHRRPYSFDLATIHEYSFSLRPFYPHWPRRCDGEKSKERERKTERENRGTPSLRHFKTLLFYSPYTLNALALPRERSRLQLL